MSQKFIIIFDKRLNVLASPPSTANSGEDLTVTGSQSSSSADLQQIGQPDQHTQDQSPLKKTACHDDKNSDVNRNDYGGTHLSETQAQSPSRKIDVSDVQSGSQTKAQSPLKETKDHPDITSKTVVETVDLDSRTIYVHDVPDHLADVIETWFESPRHDGGAVDKYLFDVDHHVAVVTFADIQGLKTCSQMFTSHYTCLLYTSPSPRDS